MDESRQEPRSVVGPISRRKFLGLASMAAVGVAMTGCGTSLLGGGAKYPSKNIELVVPTPPGGGTDIFGRSVEAAIKAHQLLPVSFAVVNKAGGNNVIGLKYAQDSKPDGYTLLVADQQIYIAQLMGEVEWNWKKDFTYIAKLADDVNLICVLQNSPFKTMADLVDAAKSKPGEIQIAGSITGSMDHVGSLLLNRDAGINTKYIPYKNSAEAVTAMLGGHVSACWANPSEIISQIEAKQARALVVVDRKRIDFMPEVPSIKEAIGLDISSTQWRGIGGPANLPKEVVDYVILTMDKLRQSENWKKEYLTKRMLVDGFLTGDALMKYMEAQEKDLKEVFASVGLLKEKK